MKSRKRPAHLPTSTYIQAGKAASRYKEISSTASARSVSFFMLTTPSSACKGQMVPENGRQRAKGGRKLQTNHIHAFRHPDGEHVLE